MIKFEETINLTEEDAANLLALIKCMAETAEVENTIDKTKRYFLKFEEL